MFQWLSGSVSTTSSSEGGMASIKSPGDWQIETTHGS
jgi:hypothetical protein